MGQSVRPIMEIKSAKGFLFGNFWLVQTNINKSILAILAKGFYKTVLQIFTKN
jgi:hypothetical protein